MTDAGLHAARDEDPEVPDGTSDGGSDEVPDGDAADEVDFDALGIDDLFAPTLLDKVLGARKAIVAVAGVVLQGGAVAGFEGTVLQWTQTALAALTAAGVYRVRNVVPEPFWTAAAAPAPSTRSEADVPPAEDEPGDEDDSPGQGGYRPEHEQGDPTREHLPEHAAPEG